MEQNLLLEKARAGDLQARNELYEASRSTVWKAVMAAKKRYRKLNIDDLQSELFIKFCYCLSRFNTNNYLAFQTYLSKAIYDAVGKYWLQDRLVPVGSVVLQYVSIKAKGGKLKPRAQRTLKRTLSECYQLKDHPVMDTGYDKLVTDETSEIIRGVVERLPARNREVIKLLYGIGTFELSPEEIALIYDISRTRVSQIKNKSLDRMWRMLSYDYKDGDL